MKQIPKEVEGTLNKYFLEEDTSDKSLNTQMITEQEMRNILELDQKRKECITKMKHYINRKVSHAHTILPAQDHVSDLN